MKSASDVDPRKVTLSIVQRGRLQQAWSNGMGRVESDKQRRTDEEFLTELLDRGRDPRERTTPSPFLAVLVDEFLGPFQPEV